MQPNQKNPCNNIISMKLLFPERTRDSLHLLTQTSFRPTTAATPLCLFNQVAMHKDW